MVPRSSNFALAAEAAATAIEKPLHDKSWRKSALVGTSQWTDPEGKKKVVDTLRDEIQQGKHHIGKVLRTGPVGERFDVARATASSAMLVLEEEGLVKRWYYGRYRVLKGPEPEVTEPPVEVPEQRAIGHSPEYWTVAELREAIKGLPDTASLRVSRPGRAPRPKQT